MKRFLYFLTTDALKKIKYRAILLLPSAFIVVVCMVNGFLNMQYGIAKIPYFIEIYIISSILLLIAYIRLMYVDME